MAKPDDKRKTDVPATIAGFYYQIMIACREICKENVAEVGVENGADVVVIDKNNKKICMEAKLHSQQFRRYSGDIIKTIYNFYNDYKKEKRIEKLYFITNEGIVDKDELFFDTWGKADNSEVEYIKKAVLKQSIKAHEECKKKYEQFCKGVADKKKCFDELEKAISDDTREEQYEEYAVVNEECTYEEFIVKLEFQFIKEEKKGLLEKLEIETKEKIKEDYQGMAENVKRESLSDEGATHIFCSLVKLFYDYIVESCEASTRRNIEVSEYRQLLKDYLNNKQSMQAADKLKDLLSSLSYDEEDIQIDLDMDNEEDCFYYECYSKVKHLFLEKLKEENGDLKFMHRYYWGKDNQCPDREIAPVIKALIRFLTEVMYEKKLSVEKIKIFFEQGLDNVEILEILKCGYKHVYGDANAKRFPRNLMNEYEKGILFNNNQIIVADGKYKESGKPCKLEELQLEPYDFTQVDENFKDYIMLKNINIKCAACLDKDSNESKRFWEGGGGLCKKI